MTRIDLHESSKLTFAEGAAPSTPAANLVLLYAKSDGLLYSKDDAGAETAVSGGGAGGNVATDAIWDAAGDLAVGTGANTAARLAIGATNGMDVRRVSGAVAWAFPPGHELDYVAFTSPVTVSGTNDAGATTIVSGTSQSYAAGDYWVEFFAPQNYIEAADSCIVTLWDSSTDLGRLSNFTAAGTDNRIPLLLRRKVTLTAATHQLIIKAWKNSGGVATIDVGAGGTGTLMPGYIRVTVA